MDMQDMADALLAFRGGAEEMPIGAALAASLLDAESVLTELASVFFAAPLPTAQNYGASTPQMQGRDEGWSDTEKIYRLLVEQIPAVVFVAFFDKGISEAYVSPQIEHTLGFTQEEWLRDPVRWYRQIHAADKNRWSTEAAQMILTGEQLRSVYRVLARDGHTVWFDCQVKMMRHADGRPWFIHGIGFDITNLKVAEAKLQQAQDELEARVRERTSALHRTNAELETEIAERKRAENQFRVAVESAPNAMLKVSRGGEILLVNSQAEQLFGYTREELIGQPLERLVPERFRHRHASYRAGFVVSPQPRMMGVGQDLYGVRKDGTEVPIEIGLNPIELEGEIVILSSIVDITERKRSETERQELYRQLVEASRQIGMAEVATNVLHNVGNVLNSINVTADLVSEVVRQSLVGDVSRISALLQAHEADLGTYLISDPRGQQIPSYLAKLAEHLVQEQAQMLQEMEALSDKIEHIKHVISQQQSLARPGSMYESARPAELVEQALQLNLAALEEHGIVITKDYDSHITMIADKHRVLQILVNLISNAKHAMLASGGLSRLSLYAGRADNQEGLIRFQVTDTGVGIKQEHLTRIFSQGFTTKQDGHGFGLHSSALAAKVMGGMLSVHSDGAGQGATFTLDLPAKPTGM
jgi:PAS domain S-box-containing protein